MAFSIVFTSDDFLTFPFFLFFLIWSQLDRDTANPAHPLNRFATGNKHTLETQSKEQGMDLRQELVKFHS